MKKNSTVHSYFVFICTLATLLNDKHCARCWTVNKQQFRTSVRRGKRTVSDSDGSFNASTVSQKTMHIYSDVPIPRYRLMIACRRL